MGSLHTPRAAEKRTDSTFKRRAATGACFSLTRDFVVARFPCVSRNQPRPSAGFEAGFFVSEISTSQNQLIDRERRAGSGRWYGPAPDSIEEFWPLHSLYK